MTDQFETIYDYTPFDEPRPVYPAGDNELSALGSGYVRLRSSPKSSVHILKRIWYVPGLKESIISKHWTRKNGLITTLDDDENFILTSSDPSSDFRAVSRPIGGLTFFPSITAIPNVAAKTLTVSTDPPAAVDATPSNTPVQSAPPSTRPNDNADSQIMHERCGHASSERLKHLDIKYTAGNCEPCILGKQTRTPFRTVEDRPANALDQVHLDHCGPITPRTYGKARYALNIRDSATGYTWSYVVANKDSKTTLKILKKWKPMVENQAGKSLKILRTDDAKEFKGVVREYLEQSGVIHEATAPYSSSSNGVVERVNRTLFDMVRPMLIRSKLPSPFWGEAIDTATKILNRLPTKSNPDDVSPHEAWFGKKPSISHFRQFGCVAYARIPTKVIGEGNKPAPRSVKCCLLGYVGNRMYRLWNPERKKIIISRDVEFKENEFLEPSAFRNIPQDFAPLEIQFNDDMDEPEDLSNLTDAPNVPDETSNGFITPKHPARPQYLPSPSSTPPIVPTANRYALLAPIPPPPAPHNEESDHDSDSDDDDDIYGTPIVPTETSSPSAPSAAAAEPEASSNSSTPNQSDTTSTHASGNSSTNNSTSASSEASASSGTSTVSNAPAITVTSAEPQPTTSTSASQTSSNYVHPARIRRPAPKIIQNREVEELLNPRSKGKSKATAKVTSTEPISPFSHAYVLRIGTFDPSLEPKSIEEALALPDGHLWFGAAVEEVDSIHERDAWTLVRRPVDQHVMNCRFACRLKDHDTSHPRHKCRLVAQGFTEIPGVDYTETYAPVVKAPSIRTILAISVLLKLHMHNFDVKTAYLYSDVKHKSYIEQPPHFEVPGYPREDWVYELNKALYGRHDSGYLWYGTVRDKLLSLNFKKSYADQCVFLLEDQGKYIIVAVYVDDFLVSGKSLDDINWLHEELNKDWEVRTMGPVKRFLGMDFHRPDPTGALFVNQGSYARRVLQEFNMQNCNPVKTPMDSSLKLHQRKEDEPTADGELYRRLTGKLMHLAVYTRPDLAFTASKLSQFNSNPSKIHMQAAKHVLRYIKGTLDHGIMYSRPDSNEIDCLPISYCDVPIGYSDASFDSDPDDSKSTSGWLDILASGAITWGSNKQSCVALSTMESEYMATTEAAKEAMFLSKLLKSLNLIKNSQIITLKIDSQSALEHIKNNVDHARTKHIQRRHNYIRDLYEKGKIDLELVPSEDQAADVLTKPLPRVKHQRAIDLLNLQSIHIETNA